jgi:hypothetical protein
MKFKWLEEINWFTYSALTEKRRLLRQKLRGVVTITTSG